jgi:hypothetical protein
MANVNGRDAWDFLATLADQNVGDGSFHEGMLLSKWQKTKLFQVHGETVGTSAKLFQTVIEELHKKEQSAELIAATTTAVDAAKELRTCEKGSPEEMASLSNLKRLLATCLVKAKVETWWGDEWEDEKEDNQQVQMFDDKQGKQFVNFEQLEGLTGINPARLFKKYLTYEKQVRKTSTARS